MRTMTPDRVAVLRAMSFDEFSDEYAAAAEAFGRSDERMDVWWRIAGWLEEEGLIDNDYSVTDAGRAVLAEVT